MLYIAILRFEELHLPALISAGVFGSIIVSGFTWRVGYVRIVLVALPRLDNAHLRRLFGPGQRACRKCQCNYFKARPARRIFFVPWVLKKWEEVA